MKKLYVANKFVCPLNDIAFDLIKFLQKTESEKKSYIIENIILIIIIYKKF